MKKWFLKAFFLLSATMLLTTGLFELYSKMPVCEERVNGRGALNNSCLPYDQVLAGDYRVRKGQVYWEDREYAPEKNCGFGVYSILANITSFKCLLEMKGYIRTVEHRTLIKVEKLSPRFRVLESKEPGLLDWQKEQFYKYAVGEQGVYFEGRLLEGADPKDFSVIFPLGDHDFWSFVSVSRTGNMTFVGGQSLGDVDLTLFRLLEPSKCPEAFTVCETDDLAQLLQAKGGVFGALGNDVIFLSAYKLVRFENKVSPGMYMFSHKAKRYLHTQGTLYELSVDRGRLIGSPSDYKDDMIWFRPDYKPLSQSSEAYLPWQNEQITQYSVTNDGVYFRGQRLDGADPRDFKVIFPFGTDAQWKTFYISKSGSVSFRDEINIGAADFREPKILLPCDVSASGVIHSCWSFREVLASANVKGVVAQLGEDVLYFHRHGVSKFIGAASTDFHIADVDGVFYLIRGGASYRLLRNSKFPALNFISGWGT
ncbi:hypothetical protein [Pseudomonas sp. W5-01]|uniref:hypothetical protein n=1 Tax=Pseudomonas sp. W5-01 TaxID=3097454 RepID=UPI0039782E82